MKKILSFVWRHKIIFLIILAVMAAGGYFVYQKINSKAGVVRYVTAAVQKGVLISSVSGTGQVSSSNQVDIKPKVSGEIATVNVKNNQEVKQGDLLIQLNTRDAALKVSEAQLTLENAKLDLETLFSPSDIYTLIQAENALTDAQESLAKLKINQENNYQTALEARQKAEANLKKAYEDAYNNIANAFLNLPDMMTGLNTVLNSREIADSDVSLNRNSNKNILINSFYLKDYEDRDQFESFVDKADNNYQEAKTLYDQVFDDYKDASRYSELGVIESLLEQSIETAKKIADTVKSEINMLDYWIEYRRDNSLKVYAKTIDYQSNLSSYTSQTNNHLSSLLGAQRSIEDYKESILKAERDLKQMEQNSPLELAALERSIQEKQQKLADLNTGPDELEIKNKQLTVQQKQNVLIEAQQSYADYFIRAPFSGTVVQTDIAKGDTVSSGTLILTLMSQQKIAEITLNEIDAAQVKVGQKATLEFDALNELSISGEVVEIDALGTVSQGVVSYGVKIAFDVQDDRIKPGMSVSASIIIQSKSDVLLAPISAVKTVGENTFVEILVDGQAQKQAATIGLSNDTFIEIIDGLSKGDQVITQTINTNDNTNQTVSNQNQGPQGDAMRAMRIMR